MKRLSLHHRSRRIFLGIVSIVSFGIILYSNILNAPFILDDYSAIVDSEAVKNISQSLVNISSNRYLTSLSFAFNYAVGGLKPFGYHLINNSIHIFNALLVYCLVVLTFKTPFFTSRLSPHASRHFFIAFSSAFIFIAHPIQTQAVTYIAQRATSMAAMFYLLSLVMYIKWRLSAEQQTSRAADQQNNRAAEQQSRSKTTTALLLYCASLFSAILVMKTKEIAFTLPVVIALYEFSFFNKTAASQYTTSNLRRFLYLLPILLTLLIIPLSMLNLTAPVETITQDINIQSRETVNITRTDYLLTQFRVIVTYLRLLVLPINQNFDYNYPVYHSFFDLQVFLSFLFLLSIFGIAVYLFYKSRRTHYASRLVAFGIFWFFITLSVESSIIPIRDVIVEHRLYLPSIGFFIAAVLSVDYLFSNMRLKTALMAAIVLALSVGAYNRNTIWKDPQTLWKDVIAKAPNNARAYNNLGVELKNKGEYDKAIEQFEKSLKADKNYTSVYFNLGDVQYRLGNYEDAVVYLKKALTLKLNQQLHLDVLNKLGRTYSAMGQTESAIDAFKEAIKVYPTAVAPYNNLGVQYIKTGRFDLAIETLEKALKIREEPYIRANLSIAYTKKMEKTKDRNAKNN